MLDYVIIMSQFGTIGTPRMHPCVSHPSCGQFNANDIILASAGPLHLAPANPKMNMNGASMKYSHSNIQNNAKSFEIARRSEMDDSNLHEIGNGNISGEEVTRVGSQSYVELSPGVWSYTG